MSNPNTWICPTEKIRIWTRIFCPNFKSGYYIFHISIVWTWFWPEFRLVQIVRPEKNWVSVINFFSEFWHYSICPTWIWPKLEFLPKLDTPFIFFWRSKMARSLLFSWVCPRFEFLKDEFGFSIFDHSETWKKILNKGTLWSSSGSFVARKCVRDNGSL